MKVFQVTPELPFFPGGSGGSTRQFKLLEALARRGHEVTVVSPVHPSQQAGRASLHAAGIALHAVDRPASRLRETATTLARHPSLIADAVGLPLLAWQVEVFWRALEPVLREAAAARGVPDIINVDHDWAARWWLDLPAGIPRTLTLQNVSGRYYDHRASAETRAPVRRLLEREARRFDAHDREHLARWDHLFAMSDHDAAAIAQLTDTPTTVVPNGVTTADVPTSEPSGPPVAVFAGSYAYPPNAEALRWLVTDLWPRVRERLPDAQLLAVGRDAPADLTERPIPGVEHLGFVEDIGAVYRRARVVLCPMRSGGGTRLKVLEALATGLPLVSTTMGAEGVRVSDGEDVLLADDPGAFADTVVRALTDDALAARIGAAGRALAESTYDWDAIGATFEATLLRLAAERGDVPPPPA